MYDKGDEKLAANLAVKQRKAARWNNKYIELKQQNDSMLYLASGSQLTAGCNLTTGSDTRPKYMWNLPMRYSICQNQSPLRDKSAGTESGGWKNISRYVLRSDIPVRLARSCFQEKVTSTLCMHRDRTRGQHKGR